MKTCNFCGSKNFDCDTECYKCKKSLSEDAVVEISQLKRIIKIILLVTIIFQAAATIPFAALWITSLIIPEWTIAALVFAILLMAFTIGLAISCIMSNYYRNKVNAGGNVGLFYKICTLLFISVIAGVAMLFDE